MRQNVFGYARAGVFHLDDHLVIPRPGRNHDTALFREFQCVVHEIRKGLNENIGVRNDVAIFASGLEPERE